jgi:phage baseplate assembly protein V
MIDIIRREIARAGNSTRQAFRGLLGSLDKTKRVQLATLEGLNGEALQATELFQHFGFTSAPPVGTQVIVLPLGGKTSAAVLVATENGNYRLQLGADGECAIYNQWGDHVWLKQNRRMELVSALSVDITTPDVNMSGRLNVAGNITGGADIQAAAEVKDQGGTKSMSGMRNVYNNHTHSDPQGGSVSTPSAGM